MKTLEAIALIAALIATWLLISHLWREWSGSFGRWRRGEPLKLSDHLAAEWQKAREKLEQEKARMRAEYEADPSRILDRAYRRRFKDLRIHDDIRGEVIRRCGMTCGGCRRPIKRRSTMHLDHIKPMKLYPALEFLASNLQVLCSRCNVHKSAYDGSDWAQVVVDRRKATLTRKAKARRIAKNTPPEP